MQPSFSFSLTLTPRRRGRPAWRSPEHRIAPSLSSSSPAAVHGSSRHLHHHCSSLLLRAAAGFGPSERRPQLLRTPLLPPSWRTETTWSVSSDYLLGSPVPMMCELLLFVVCRVVAAGKGRGRIEERVQAWLPWNWETLSLITCQSWTESSTTSTYYMDSEVKAESDSDETI